MKQVTINPIKIFKSEQVGGIFPGAIRTYQPFRTRDKSYPILANDIVKNFKSLNLVDKKTGSLTESGRDFMKKYFLTLSDTKRILNIPSDAKDVNGEETDYIDYLTALDHPKIANSEDEITPSSEYYISDQEAEAETAVNTFNHKLEALKIVDEKLNGRELQMLTLLVLKEEGGSGYSYDLSTLSPKAQQGRLIAYAEEDPKAFCEIFNSPDRDTKFLIGDLISYDILSCEKGQYKYNGNLIGLTQESTVTYLNDSTNRELRESFCEQIASIKKQR